MTFLKNTRNRVLSQSNIHIIIVLVFHRILDFKSGAGFLSRLLFLPPGPCSTLTTNFTIHLFLRLWRIAMTIHHSPYGTTNVLLCTECALK